MEKGVYYLYFKKQVVYIGMSTTNCMQRILSHYNDKEKEFDSFQIFRMPKHTDAQIAAKEKRLIQRKLPKYNVVHAKTIENKNWKTEIEIKKDEVLKSVDELDSKMPFEFKEKYFSYVSSTKWHMVCEEHISNYPICQRCTNRRAVKVKHKSYESLFNEKTEHLISLCDKCNGRKKLKENKKPLHFCNG